MSILMGNILCFGKINKLEQWVALAIYWPLETFIFEIVDGSHQIYYIPARIVVLVLPTVGIHKISIEKIANELIVELDGVVACHRAAWNTHFALYPLRELIFG